MNSSRKSVPGVYFLKKNVSFSAHIYFEVLWWLMFLPSTSLLCVPSHRLKFFSVLLSPNPVPLQGHFGMQKSGIGMWRSCLALQSCKRVTMAWLLFVSLKIREKEDLSGQVCSDRPKCQRSQCNCILLFHFKGFAIVNTGRTPNPAKIQEHQLCCLLAYRNISLSLAMAILSWKESVFYSVVNILSVGRDLNWKSASC